MRKKLNSLEYFTAAISFVALLGLPSINSVQAGSFSPDITRNLGQKIENLAFSWDNQHESNLETKTLPQKTSIDSANFLISIDSTALVSQTSSKIPESRAILVLFAMAGLTFVVPRKKSE